MAPSFHPDQRYDAAHEIVTTLRNAGYQAYLAGGCVRDLLLGLAAQDYDVATSATPDIVLQLFPDKKTLTVGAHFGVVLVCEPNNGGDNIISTEVATFRHDGVYSDGRRPDTVRYSTDPREDVRRRDFTINGMLLDPAILDQTGDATAATLDYVGGRDDLRSALRKTHKLVIKGFGFARLNQIVEREECGVDPRIWSRPFPTWYGSSSKPSKLKRVGSTRTGVERGQYGKESF